MGNKQKKLVAFLTSLFLMITIIIPTNLIPAYAEENSAKDGNVTIDVLTFNDFHGAALESGKNVGAAKLAGVINSYKDKTSDTYGIIPVSGGDLYQGSAISNLKEGAPITDMVKAIGLEASAVGNHEFDWSQDKIGNWAKEGNFSFLAANIVKKGTNEIVDYAQPYKIVERNGIKIGFIGITTPETATISLAKNVEGIEFKNPVDTINEWAPKVRAEGANAVVALTHCPAYQDNNTKEITGEVVHIAKTGNVDAVIAAHNHAFVCGQVDKVPIVEGGHSGRGLGKLTFTFDKEKKISSISESVDNFEKEQSQLPVNKEVDDKISVHKKELEPIMAKEITSLDEELMHGRRISAITPLGVAVAESMRQITGTDIGICNGGGIRTSLPKGNVTVGNMYEILPFDNTLETLKLKGEDVVKVIEHGINTPDNDWAQFAGIKVIYNKETGKTSSIKLNNGAELEKDKYYTLTINDFMATGGGEYDFSKAVEKNDTKKVMREELSDYWKKNGVPRVDINILIPEEDNTKTTSIQVLSTTDLHGKFKNFSYPIDNKENGGLNQVSMAVKAARAENPNTILVDNGDAIQGNYNHLFTTEEYMKNGGKNPMGLAFQTIGYDAISLGNHEFNFGMNFLDSYKDQVESAGIQVLCANLYKDDSRVFKPYEIKEIDGIKVGMIGVVSPHITRWDADKLLGYTPTNPAQEVKKAIEEMKNSDNVPDVYMVISHVGLTSEYGDGDSATDIANENPDVSLVIAGHSHTTIDCEKVNNAIITQPTNAAKGVSKAIIEVKKTDDGKVTVVSKNASVIKMDENSPEDENLNEILKPYDAEAIKDAHSIIGKLDKDLAEENDFEGAPQSFVSDQGVTDLINEVQMYYSNKHLEAKGIEPSKVHHISSAAMLSATANMKAGDITKAGVSNIYKFDNTLYTVKTTGKQLKKYLEWTVSYYNTFKDGDLNISFNKDKKSYNYDMFEGINYEINISKEPGTRIENLTFPDGVTVKDQDEIYLTMNNYRYNSHLNAKENPIFDAGEHEKVYDSTNDELFAIRDMIANYIVEVQGGKIERKVNNNWKLTGVKYNEEVRNKTIELIKSGVVTTATDKYGVTNTSLRWDTLANNLTSKNNKIVDVLSFNDFHGNVLEAGKNVGAAKLAGVINGYKSNAGENYGVIPVSGGDMYQGTAISNLKIGEPVTSMLKAIGLEASAIGNHEFDWGSDKIANWGKEGGFPFLAANIVDEKTGKIVDYAEPYKIVERNGVKVAFIGISTPDTAVQTLAENVKGVKFLDPAETVTKYAEIARKEGANVVIALTHCGAYQDIKTGKITGETADIANKAKGIDAIVAAHNHVFVSGIVNNIPIVEGGCNGRGLGSLRFIFNEKNEVVNVIGTNDKFLGREASLPEDEEVKAKVGEIKDSLAEILGEKITHIDKRLSHDERKEALTELGAVVAESMRLIAGTDVAVTNGGGIRRSLEAGDVTVGDMYELMPFDNTLVTLKVKGEGLVKIIEHGINTEGFAWGQFAGVKAWYDKETGKVSSLRLMDGTPIDMNKYYSVTINDFMLTGGDKYDFSNAIEAVNTNKVMRDEMSALWKKSGIPEMDANLLIAGKDENGSIDVVKPDDNNEQGEIVKPDNNVEPGEGDKPGETSKPSETIKPVTNKGNEKKNLPKTGMPFSPDAFAGLGVMIAGLGAVLVKKNKKIS